MKVVTNENSVALSNTREGKMSFGELGASQIRDELLRRLEKTDCSNVTPEMYDKFARIFRVLPEIADVLIERYVEILSRYDISPGEVRLYAVGGRIKSTPMSADSDIDLIFEVKHFQSGLDGLWKNPKYYSFFENSGEAYGSRQIYYEELMKLAIDECQQLQVAGEFHILNYGQPLSSNESAIGESYILLSKRVMDNNPVDGSGDPRVF